MNKERFLRLLNERILILDGGMGTMIQSFKLNEQDYRGKRFADFPGQLKGNNDLLCITRPDVIQSIHRQYLDAGADIFATNTFNANAISMADYAMEAYVREINLAAGRLSREVADTYMAEHPDRTIFVAGSIGPTNKTASMSPDVSDPAYRAVTYKDLYNAYKEQVEGLVDGGVDIILFETTFDTLNVKAGLEAAEVVLKEKEKDLPDYVVFDFVRARWTNIFRTDFIGLLSFHTAYTYCFGWLKLLFRSSGYEALFTRVGEVCPLLYQRLSERRIAE